MVASSLRPKILDICSKTGQRWCCELQAAVPSTYYQPWRVKWMLISDTKARGDMVLAWPLMVLIMWLLISRQKQLHLFLAAPCFPGVCVCVRLRVRVHLISMWSTQAFCICMPVNVQSHGRPPPPPNPYPYPPVQIECRVLQPCILASALHQHVG